MKKTTNEVLIKQALSIGKKYKVFPVKQDKMPCWSNEALGVTKGNGGFKIATSDPKVIRMLFEHPDAECVAVPMAMNGMVAIDVDTYKDQDSLNEWRQDHYQDLFKVKCHETQSGGLHYFFKDPEVKLPSTLRSGIDVKQNGFVLYI